ncbi:unnamed protein product, partial [Sphacelaria rigidula]
MSPERRHRRPVPIPAHRPSRRTDRALFRDWRLWWKCRLGNSLTLPAWVLRPRTQHRLAASELGGRNRRRVLQTGKLWSDFS